MSLFTDTSLFRHRCVQDLAWVIGSPPVISGQYNRTRWLSFDDCQREYQACKPYLYELDKHPEKLEAALAKVKPYVIGKRFETLIGFWLEISPNFRLLAHNHVLHDGNRTIGEADFIIEDISSGKIIHLEVAVKFYLGFGDLSQADCWHGPNLRDRLDIKLNHLQQHQTQISYKYPELLPYPIDESWCLLKGRMYYPHDQFNPQLFFADDCLAACWYIDSSVPRDKEYLALERKDWMTEISGITEPLETLPSSVEYSQCFARIEQGSEVERCFVVPEDFWEGIENDI